MSMLDFGGWASKKPPARNSWWAANLAETFPSDAGQWVQFTRVHTLIYQYRAGKIILEPSTGRQGE